MTTRAVRVYMTSDQTNIEDRHHTLLAFNSTPDYVPVQQTQLDPPESNQSYARRLSALPYLHHNPLGEWLGASHSVAAYRFHLKPQITVPTWINLGARVSWGHDRFGDASPPRGYAKFWFHIQRPLASNPDVKDPDFEINLGEGAMDGILSAANPRIAINQGIMFEPGWVAHTAFIGFIGSDHHVIQSGVEDLFETPNRSNFWAHYEA